jgi:hypothetical protein
MCRLGTTGNGLIKDGTVSALFCLTNLALDMKEGKEKKEFLKIIPVPVRHKGTGCL